MYKSRNRVVESGLCALLALSLLLAACGGETAEAPLESVADVAIEVEHPDRETVTYRVACLEDTATITGDTVDVIDRDACATLSRPEVIERIVNGPHDGACTEIYGGPDVATIIDTVDAVDVEASFDRANGCGIADWDDLLAGLLPPAVGVTG